MDKRTATAVLAEQLRLYRTKPYALLKDDVGQVNAYEVTTPDGSVYQIEVQVFWDGKPGGDIRVMAAIDDRGWRAVLPPSESFIMMPDGTFVDE